MTPDIIIWKSGCVKRWHSSIDRELRESGDTTGAHSHRVAMLILMLHPLPSAHLLACALTHDTPEVMTGDVPRPMKDGVFGEMLERIEDQVIDTMKLPKPEAKDRAWVKLCDSLDAILWVRDHAPYLLASPDWVEMWEGVLQQANALNVKDKVEELVGQ